MTERLVDGMKAENAKRQYTRRQHGQFSGTEKIWGEDAGGHGGGLPMRRLRRLCAPGACLVAFAALRAQSMRLMREIYTWHMILRLETINRGFEDFGELIGTVEVD